MKKSDLKKIAMIGIASGLIVAADASAVSFGANTNLSKHLAAGGCAGKNGCQGQGTPSQPGQPQGEGSQAQPSTTGQRSQYSRRNNQNNNRTNTRYYTQAGQNNEGNGDDGQTGDAPSGQRVAKLKLYADADVSSITEPKNDPKKDKDNVSENTNGTNNGVKYAMLHHKEGELSESRLISQLSKENLDKYRKLSYEDKSLVRRYASETGDANKGFQKAIDEVNAKTRPGTATTTTGTRATK